MDGGIRGEFVGAGPGRLVRASLRHLAHKETVLCCRHKVIIDEIRRLHVTGMGVGAAVESVELIWQRGALSLYQLYLLLNRHKSR